MYSRGRKRSDGCLTVAEYDDSRREGDRIGSAESVVFPDRQGDGRDFCHEDCEAVTEVDPALCHGWFVLYW